MFQFVLDFWEKECSFLGVTMTTIYCLINSRNKRLFTSSTLKSQQLKTLSHGFFSIAFVVKGWLFNKISHVQTGNL